MTAHISVNAETRFVVLLGNPVAHSRSPLLHNTAFRRQNFNAVYVAARVAAEELERAIGGLRALGALGANVTIPHKQAVLPFLDVLSEEAAAVGAVNTITRCEQDGAVTLHGDNTDVAGFLDPLEPFVDRLQGAEVVVFGAGGGARAVTYALLTRFAPSRLTLAVRRPPQAEALAGDLASHDRRDALRAAPLEEAGPLVRSSTLVVNATPLGMHPHPEGTPWAREEDFGEGQIAYDLVYAPRRTRFLKDAAVRGATPVGGLAMLLGQAAAAYRQWTDRPFPLEAVRQALFKDRGS